MPDVAAMDFFQHQDVARRKTSLLVFYYILSVVLIVLSVYGAFVAAFYGVQAYDSDPGDVAVRLWNPQVFLWVTGVTLAIVAGGTFFKVAQLAGGGESVASMLGGRPIDPATTDRHERKILNVVEEMAIASGTPIPRVFVLDDEEGINAFAAGFTPNDAVIGVTRGCIATLNRDELQGVIAHEFSHVLNGDMKLNIRLTGVLHGILVISMIGYGILRTMLHGSRHRSRSSKSKGNPLPFILFGLLIMIIGYVGVFFGKLIKSAVSRQREFLADASAVQFTRNPDGIAGALKKIGGFVKGSKLAAPHAEETSHFFFCNGLSSSWLGLMATHPPLEERIRRLDPSFSGSFVQVAARGAGSEVGAVSGLAGEAVRGEGAASMVGAAGGPATPPPIPLQPGAIIARVGTLTAAHLAYAAHIKDSFPTAVLEATRSVEGSRTLLYAMLLGKEEKVRSAQVALIAKEEGATQEAAVGEMVSVLHGLPPEGRLPAADLAVAALASLAPEAYVRFKALVTSLAEADSELDLFEYALKGMILRRLAPRFEKVRPPAVEYYDMSPLLAPAGHLLSCLAYWGADDMDAARHAFEAGVRSMGKGPVSMSPLEECGLQTMDGSLKQLRAASPVIKRTILGGVTACIAADKQVRVEEADILRAVADTLDCPVPPFLPGQPL